MNPSRRTLALTVTSAALFCASFGVLGGAQAQGAADYPNKPVKLVVPFPAGGSSDAMGRLMADKLSGVLKQSVVVDNKGGAGGLIGTDLVAKSPADGYTLVLVDVFHSSTPIYTRKMPYDAVKDFAPVSLIGRSPAFLVANPNIDQKTGADLLKFGKANPNKLSLAIAGTGSVVADLFKARSGMQFVAVPYRGSSPAMVDLLSGQVNIFITTMASAGPHVKSGKLRAMAVTGNKRHPDFSDVPTFDELGIKGMDYEQWFGLMAPAATPKPVLDKLSAAMGQVLQMPDVREKLQGMALDVATPGPVAMKDKLESDVARWQRLAKELDIKPLD
jgi:tripartite-type tricarboxylate transporter receptor subunit TctC